MCQLVNDLDTPFVIGYKVVLLGPEGEYISPATGVRYPQSGPIPQPEIKEYEQLFCGHFVSLGCLLTPGNFSYSENLVGRTACFKSPEDAQYLKSRLISSDQHTEFEGNKYKIIKVKLCGSLMSGVYGYYSVVAGKRMEILDEDLGDECSKN